jgi:NADH-quinone oxidoreductase subunit J
MQPILFIFFGGLAIIGGIAVITFRNPVYSALALVVTLFSQAGLFLLLGAYFVAAVQIIVYAGAIMVLFLFVIMLLNLGSIDAARPAAGVAKGVAIVLGVLFAAQAVYVAVNVSQATVGKPADLKGGISTAVAEIEATYELDRTKTISDYVTPQYSKTSVEMLTESEARDLILTLRRDNMGKTKQIGSVLFSKFLLPFEVTSLILLAALIGVIVLVKREPKTVG